MNNTLVIVLPCFNEEAALPQTLERMTALLSDMIAKGLVSRSSRLLFVDDGSKDKTWELISEAHADNKAVCGLRLAHNSGHQNALIAGMDAAVGMDADMIITIDADLQDDISVIPEMVAKCADGVDIVYGVRRQRDRDSWMKRVTAQTYYKIMKSFGVDLVYNHADFRLLSRAVTERLLRYRERNLFLRGIVPSLGNRTDCVYYDRLPREAGETKYTVAKMTHLAADGITSFTDKPVKALIWFGLLFLLVAFGILCYVLVSFFTGNTVSGWSSLMLSLWFIGGCVMIGLGIVGLYIGKIYFEVKDRPRYHVETTLIG